MRILKYIVLLLLLLGIAFIVFVATQKADYKIVRAKEIKISKDVVFSFVTDSSSNQDWSPWKSNEATFENIKVVPNDSLEQNISISEIKNESLIRFQKTKNGVLLTWEMKGNLDFNLKLLSVLQGGVENVLGDKLEEGLLNINNYLTKELKTYDIKVNGVVTKHMTNYIQQIDTCSISEFQKVSKTMLQNMMHFVEKNNIEIVGLPFITYENVNFNKKEIIFSMCVPVVEEILTTPGSEISGGHFDEFTAVKATLTGDYSHRKNAWNKARNFARKNRFIEDSFNGKFIEIYKVSLPKERKPSKWVTEFYVPVKKKVYIPKPKPEATENVNTTPIENTTTKPTE